MNFSKVSNGCLQCTLLRDTYLLSSFCLIFEKVPVVSLIESWLVRGFLNGNVLLACNEHFSSCYESVKAFIANTEAGIEGFMDEDRNLTTVVIGRRPFYCEKENSEAGNLAQFKVFRVLCYIPSACSSVI